MDNWIDNDRCSGCGACVNACPKDAITINHSVRGTIPSINQDLCVNCGKCVKSCPVNKEINRADKIYPIVFAACIKDNNSIRNSSSGGVFFELGKSIIEQSGLVYGAVFDDEFKVKITKANTIETLSFMQGSKYVESSTGYTFRDVERELKSGRKVLYSALPCQIAGLVTYLGKDYDNLVTVDLVCHGTPSENLHLDYLSYYQSRYGNKLEKISHRYKVKKWNPENPMHYLYSGSYKEVKPLFYDAYLNGFINGLFYKNSCYKCEWARLPRVSDITLGDYAGLGVIEKCEENFDAGVTQVIINTKKGEACFNNCANQIIRVERPLIEPLFFNPNLYKPTEYRKICERFWDDYEKLGWEELRKKYMDRNPKKRAIYYIKRLIVILFGCKIALRGMLWLRKKGEKENEVLNELDDIFKGVDRVVP